MTKLLKVTLLAVLCIFLTANTLEAAFPLGKPANKAATQSQLTAPATTAVTAAPTKGLTNKEAKKEFKSYFKEKGKGNYGGGKSKIVAALLAFFVGSLGIHSFYMGQTTKGFVQLGATVLGIVLYAVGIAGFVSGEGLAFPTLALVGLLLILGVNIWALVDFVRILTGGLEPEEGFDD